MNPNPEDYPHGAAADPTATPEVLRHLAATRPDLRAIIASNPATDAALLAWLSSLNDPTIQSALNGRQNPSFGPETWRGGPQPSGLNAPAPGGAPHRKRSVWLWAGIAAAIIGVVALVGGLAFGISGGFRAASQADLPVGTKPMVVPLPQPSTPSSAPDVTKPPTTPTDPFANWSYQSSPAANANGVLISPTKTFPDPDRSEWTDQFPHRFHYWMTRNYERTPSDKYVSVAFRDVPEVIMPLSMALTCEDSDPIFCGSENESITIMTGTTRVADRFFVRKSEECRQKNDGVVLDTASYSYALAPGDFSLSVYQCELPAEGITWREYYLYKSSEFHSDEGSRFLQIRDEWKTDGETLDGWETQQLAYSVMTSWVAATF